MDLLGGSANNKSQFTSNVADIFSLDLGLNNNPSPVQTQPLYQQPQYQQPLYQQQQQQAQYQQQQNYQTSYQQQPLFMQNLGDQFNLNSQYLSQSAQQQQQPLYSNISLNLEQE